MAQFPMYLDYFHVFQSIRSFKGRRVRANKCRNCGKHPKIVLMSAAYETHLGKTLHKGKFNRVQMFCPSGVCEWSIYKPLEASTVKRVLDAWNAPNYPQASVKITVSTEERGYGV